MTKENLILDKDILKKFDITLHRTLMGELKKKRRKFNPTYLILMEVTNITPRYISIGFFDDDDNTYNTSFFWEDDIKVEEDCITLMRDGKSIKMVLKFHKKAPNA